MNKKELRSIIRAQKRAMTEEMIVQKSEKLGELFVASELYRMPRPSMATCPTTRKSAPCPCWSRP